MIVFKLCFGLRLYIHLSEQITCTLHQREIGVISWIIHIIGGI